MLRINFARLERSLVLALAAALAVLAARQAHADPAGFAFLKVPSGARASAMGGAYASVAEGAEGAWWNPAALEGAKGVQIVANHYEYFADLRTDQFAVAGRMFGGGVSASLRALYSEPIPERDELGNLLGTFGSHDLEFALGYGAALSPGVRLGGTMQVLRERIADNSATAWAVSFGSTWQPQSLKSLRFSADVRDLGPSTHFTIDGTAGNAVALPTAMRLGASWTHGLAGLGTCVALETSATSGQAGITSLGAEITHSSGLAIRGGLRMGDTESGWALGAGWAVRGLKLDYAFVPFKNDLGDTQRFSIGAQF
jgi:hypothetical protein